MNQSAHQPASPTSSDAAVTSQPVTATSLSPAIALLLASAECCDTNAAARDDKVQAEEDRTNAASFRCAARLLAADAEIARP